MTLVRRFAGITPEVVENVRTGEKIEGWLAWSHTLLASIIGAKPEHAGVGAPDLIAHFGMCGGAGTWERLSI